MTFHTFLQIVLDRWSQLCPMMRSKKSSVTQSYWKKITKQGYNYLDGSIQEMSGFFETRVENLQTLAPSPAVRSLTWKKKNSMKRKAVFFVDSDEDSSDDKKPPNKKKFCQYHGKCSHSTDECTALKALI